jgi:cytochrome c-type biogenesis protein CcmE
VIYHDAKPQDFEKSEKVVIIGSMKNGQFEAKSLLLKCPSKYNDQKPSSFGERTFGK